MGFGINSFLFDSCVKASPNNLKMRESQERRLMWNKGINFVQHSNNTG